MFTTQSNAMQRSLQTLRPRTMGEIIIPINGQEPQAGEDTKRNDKRVKIKLDKSSKTPETEHRVVENIGLVYHVANQLKIPSYLWDDCISEGMLVLYKCAVNYDLSKGFTFSTYACISIKGVMLSVTIGKYSRYRSMGAQLDEEMPLPESWAINHKDHSIDIDIPIDILTTVEKMIIYCYYFENMTQEEIGIKLNLSKQMISLKRRAALEKLKHEIQNKAIS